MKDILVSYTRQEKDEATGNYISVNHKGYIQHWDCCPTHTMAIILSIEGKFHHADFSVLRYFLKVISFNESFGSTLIFSSSLMKVVDEMIDG